MKNLLTPLAKSLLVPLGLTAAASAAKGGIHKVILRSEITLIILYEEMKDIMKIVKSLKDSFLLMKGVT